MLSSQPSTPIRPSEQGLRTRIYEGISALPGSYDSLFNAVDLRWFYFSRAWYRNFEATALDPGDQVRWYGIENRCDEAPLLALPMRHRIRRRGPFKVRELSALSNFYTSLYGPIVNHDDSSTQTALNVLANLVVEEGWDVIDLRPLDVNSTLFAQMLKALLTAGLMVQRYFCFGNWYAQVNGRSYQQYFETLPSALKNTLIRKNKKLQKAAGAQVNIYTSPVGIEEAIQLYERAYLASWKVPEPYPHFAAGLIRVCAEKGWLRLGVICMENEPIAVQLWIIKGDHATIFKLAHDERFAQYSAGSILTARLMEHAIDVDHVREIDFGSGDDEYKKSWLPQRRERWGLLCFNRRSFPGLALGAWHLGGRATKSLVTRFLSAICRS